MRENTQTDKRATTTVSQEVPETPPVETRELGVTNAPSTPDVESMPRRQDKHANASTRETIEHAMDSWPKESPKKPTVGKAGDREPAKASECNNQHEQGILHGHEHTIG